VNTSPAIFVIGTPSRIYLQFQATKVNTAEIAIPVYNITHPAFAEGTGIRHEKESKGSSVRKRNAHVKINRTNSTKIVFRIPISDSYYMATTQPTPMKQFLSFTEARLLPVYEASTTLPELLECYRLWWISEGKRTFGGQPLTPSQFQAFLNQQYGFKYTDTTYQGIYISYE
jgi:hypothetical protein